MSKERGLFTRFMESLMPDPESVEEILDRAKGGDGGKISERKEEPGVQRINMSKLGE